uniref:Testin n=2 Tax=Dendroctonus ponderosae TaxID=77166 RepID=A0AAR5Q7A9_DENPD
MEALHSHQRVLTLHFEMSGEIEVPETPNWLNDLEAKRERRLKVRLGHEAGAGAPCLKCGDKCPGLDLHFWRKACKICRCPKEEHDVPDDDIYGWAQFQLLGSKPNKIKTKIVLPGINDEVELDWAPKGQKDTIDKYLQTLPTEALPVKGSQAAHQRKQLLQKQIPIHDIDPSLCHELNEEEVAKMEEYIGHIKNSSVGVGQIVTLSNVINANIHNISPQEAHIIASRYSQGVPLSEIVKVQADLAQSLENLALNRSRTLKNQSKLPNMQPVKSTPIIGNESQNASSPASKFKDITHPWYSTSSAARALNAQYPEALKSTGTVPYLDCSVDDKLMQGTKFNPALTPGQFVKNCPPGQRSRDQEIELNKEAPHIPGYNSLTHPSANRKSHDQYGFENPYFNQKQLPEYSPFKYHIQSETQDPQLPKTVKDLMYSTYDATKRPATQSQVDKNRKDYNDVSHKHKQADRSSDNRHIIPKYDPLVEKSAHEDFRYPQSGDLHTHLIDDNNANRSIGKKLPQFETRVGKFSPECCGYPDDGMGQRPGQENLSRATNFGESGYPNPESSWIIPSIKSEPEEGSFAQRNMPSDSPHTNILKQAESNLNKVRGPLYLLEPRQLIVREDHLEPYMVNVGPIQDINPEIKAATTELNPGFDRDSVYSDSCSDFSPENIKDILGDIKLPDCHYCKKPFQESEFAITIDRASALFHAQCFRCAGCNQNLADNIYFYHKETDNVYCGRDYAKIKGYPRCSACDELIFTKEYCLAEDATFHLKHFCCFQCDVPLAGQDYTIEEEKPYCLPCYETSKAATCNACEKIIKPDERGCQLNGVHFHAEDRCFSCIVCKVPLMGKKLLLRNDKLFCSHACFNVAKN